MKARLNVQVWCPNKSCNWQLVPTPEGNALYCSNMTCSEYLKKYERPSIELVPFVESVSENKPLEFKPPDKGVFA